MANGAGMSTTESPSVESKKAALAKLLAQAKRTLPSAPKPRATSGPVDLSAQQRTLWLTDRLDPGTSAYNVPYLFRICGGLDADALATALSRVMGRHDALTTYFDSSGESPLQDVDPGTPIPFTVHPEVQSEADALEQLTVLANTGFDLSRSPMWRAELLRIRENDYFLQIVFHHIIFDGTSASIFFSELTREYAAALDGVDSTSKKAAIDYLDYSEWQRERIASGAWEEHKDYWRDRLRGTELMQVIGDRPLPPKFSYSGNTVTCTGRSAKTHIDTIAARAGVSSFTAHFAVVCAVLMKYAATEDIIVGIPTANRTHEEFSEVIGYFINMLPLRIDNDQSATMDELVAVCHSEIRNGMAHGELPLEEIVKVSEIPRDSSRSGIFQTGMTVVPDEQRDSEYLHHPSLTVSSVDLPGHTARYQLSFSIREMGPDLEIELEYSTDIFEPVTARRITEAFFSIAAQAAGDGGVKILDMSLLDGDGYAEELSRGVAPEVSLEEVTVPEAFVRQCSLTPEGMAVSDEDGPTSYRQLSAAACWIRAKLQEVNLEAGDRVAVLVHRTAVLPASYLAVMSLGAVVVPLDPANPDHRLQDILEDSAPRAILVSPELAGRIPVATSEGAPSPAVVLLPPRHVGLGAESAESAVFEFSPFPPNTPAYVLYTSGSTGRPKGVVVSHGSLTTFIENTRELFELSESDRVLGYASVGFDVSMFEMFAALLTGASIHYVPTENRLDMGYLARFIADGGITVTDLPPSVMSLLDPEEYRALRIVFVGGEAFSYELVNKWAPGRRFFNGYGPTECTVTMVVHECTPGGAGLPPIGLPMRGHVAHVLDESRRLQAPGLVGELAVGGVGLALGYLNRPEAQNAAFIENPFGTTEDGRLYLTGDYVRRDVEGNLVYVGRKDSQVKIGGVRIELGEVEAQLRLCPDVRQCHARVTEHDGVKRLDAYVVLKEGSQLAPRDMREFAAARVMPAMVPATFTILEALPLNPSGKVDGARLPAAILELEELVDAASETERRLVDEVYGPLLGVERVSVTSGFFEAGGTSLQAARLLARIRKMFDVEVPLADFFADSTPRVMARRVDKALLARLPEDELMARLEAMTDEEAAMLLEEA